MSQLQRTPPRSQINCATGSGGGSTSNLSNLEDEEERINKNPRKRRPHTLEYDFKSDLSAFRTEIMSFFKEMRTDIQQEIKEIKSTTENLSSEYKKLNTTIEKIATEYKITQNKITSIESELNQLKNNKMGSHQQTIESQHSIIQEIQERFVRERNVIMVGLTEKTDKNPTIRNNQDYEAVHKILTCIDQNCPKPIKTIRLGKYNPEKPRPLKVIFETPIIPKQLLKNRSKVSDTNIKIYADQTPAQMKYIQGLKNELKQREDNGEANLTIKYIKGIPVISKTDSSSKN